MNEKALPKTVLSVDCRITGELSLEGDAVIMGTFSGVLRVSGVLELGAGAQASGTILVGALRLAGAADADVVAEHGVELLKGSSLRGQIYTTRLAVVEGAAFDGELYVGPNAMDAAGSLLRALEAPAVASPSHLEGTSRSAGGLRTHGPEAAHGLGSAGRVSAMDSHSVRRARVLANATGLRSEATNPPGQTK